jgi:hypothetical protein
MILFHSGGSPIPEVSQDRPTIMLSYYVDTKDSGKKPNARLRQAMKARRSTGRSSSRRWRKCPPA